MDSGVSFGYYIIMNPYAIIGLVVFTTINIFVIIRALSRTKENGGDKK